MPQVDAEAGIGVGNVVVDLATRRNDVNTVDKPARAGRADIVDEIPDDVNISRIIIDRGVNTAAPASRAPDVVHNVMDMVVFYYIPRTHTINTCPPYTIPVDFETIDGCVCALTLPAPDPAQGGGTGSDDLGAPSGIGYVGDAR